MPKSPGKFFKLLGECVDPFRKPNYKRYLPKGESQDPWIQTGNLIKNAFKKIETESPELTRVRSKRSKKN